MFVHSSEVGFRQEEMVEGTPRAIECGVDGPLVDMEQQFQEKDVASKYSGLPVATSKVKHSFYSAVSHNTLFVHQRGMYCLPRPSSCSSVNRTRHGSPHPSSKNRSEQSSLLSPSFGIGSSLARLKAGVLPRG